MLLQKRFNMLLKNLIAGPEVSLADTGNEVPGKDAHT